MATYLMTTFITLATVVSMAMAYTGKVLIVSFDGFRWDYLNNIDGLVNFDRMAREGVKVPYMNATFSTVTFPNHYTIATGLYEESHGMVLNKMYDPEFDAWFGVANTETRWWEGGEPIWITAVKEGRKSGAFHWSGSSVEIQGLRATFYTEYNGATPWHERVDTTLGWFTEEDIDVGLIYYHEPDETGHYYGPQSDEVADKVREVDGYLGYLLDKLEETGLDDTINLLVVSDHGMANISYEQVVDLLDYIDLNDTQVIIDSESVCMILPQPGREEHIFHALDGAHPHMHVYKKEDMKEEWHYKDHRRILPIQVVMDESWQCAVNKSANEWIKIAKGNHGWDNNNLNMKTIFLARGPDFKSNYSSPTINNIDIYPLICELMELTGAPNNGSLDNMKHMLVDEETSAGTALEGSGVMVLLEVLINLMRMV